MGQPRREVQLLELPQVGRQRRQALQSRHGLGQVQEGRRPRHLPVLHAAGICEDRRLPCPRNILDRQFRPWLRLPGRGGEGFRLFQGRGQEGRLPRSAHPGDPGRRLQDGRGTHQADEGLHRQAGHQQRSPLQHGRLRSRLSPTGQGSDRDPCPDGRGFRRACVPVRVHRLGRHSTLPRQGTRRLHPLPQHAADLRSLPCKGQGICRLAPRPAQVHDDQCLERMGRRKLPAA